MLMLSRKVGQRVVINGNIIVEISRVDFNTVRLAIEAPPEVIVDREEVHKARTALVEEKKP